MLQGYRKLAQANWIFWRPIMAGKASFSEVERMSMAELYELNGAIDEHIEQEKKARAKK